MNDITALAQRLKVYAEEFSYPVLSPDDCRALVEALEKAKRHIAQVTAERDALREGEMGNAKHSNTRAAADIYFQLVEECDIPAGGSLVEFVDGLKERVTELESRTVTVKLPERYDITGDEDGNCFLNDASMQKDPCGSFLLARDVLAMLAVAGIQVIEGEGQ